MAATESNPIILYDIISLADPPAWSPNVWRARFVLNYKRLPYKTIWVSLPDIASTLQSLGVEPSPAGMPYTLPVIADPTASGPPKIIRESLAIAQYLDITYPDIERPLFPNGSHALQALFLHHVSNGILPTMRDLIIPLVPPILDEAALPHFRRTREAFLKKPLEEARPKGAELEEAWGKAKEQFGVLDSALQKNDVRLGGTGGNLVLGKQPSYADFILVAWFVAMSKLESSEDGNIWEKVKGWHAGRWERMWKECEGFMQVM
ncbi:hypothetical protein BOTBODRAFT_67848 [Botryobasidium botryosum FD-172 SS1]|uniref:Uncharacterized protein n=1 Tax=Botryobasidium botryosum (strain FD-172 SS1) TaxID=930990 RepID=A0A067MAF2_BOTB1|nr:hypothetical protein BOTBODRAFT_67848 [Botryobasidium botryosum FD-172 SS1]